MATTWMKALHTGKGKSAMAALGERIGYVMDSRKTEGGLHISAYECGPRTAATEFMLPKKQYAHITGREQGAHDVIAYHIRQSFKPGEATPEDANAIAYELAMSFTKGRHAFIVATHTNTNSVHSHIIFNSTNLNCDGKFADFKRSAIALRRVSDRICLEHGLSVIEKPGLSPGRNYGKLQGGGKAPSARDRIRALIDSALSDSKNFEAFLVSMKSAGAISKHGKHLAFKLPGGERFMRCKSLGEDYTEAALRERISGKRVVTARSEVTPVSGAASRKPNLLIDIQAKMQEGKGEGYRHWATGFNLKQAARTLLFLQEHGVESYGALSEKAIAAASDFNACVEKIRAAEGRMYEITELQKHIGAYKRTLDTYRRYRDSGWSEEFYNEHAADIILHKAAKKHFDECGFGREKKLPAMQTLRQEYAAFSAEKKKLYAGYKKSKEEMAAWQTAKRNADMLLGHGRDERVSRERKEGR